MPAPTNGLIRFYNLESLVGSNLLDLGSEHVNASTSGTLAATTGTVGICRSFDGASSKITTDPTLPIVNKGFTITAWVRPRSTKFGIICSIGNSTNFIGYGNVTPNQYHFQVTSQFTTNSLNSASHATGHWDHVAMTAAMSSGGGTMVAYMNGTAIGTTPGFASGTGSVTVGHFVIGYLGLPSNFHDGKIDEVRLYDRALSSTEIANTYADAGSYPLAIRKLSYFPALFPGTVLQMRRRR